MNANRSGHPPTSPTSSPPPSRPPNTTAPTPPTAPPSRCRQADAATDPDQRAELAQAAKNSVALAEIVEEQVPVLEQADLDRGEWYLHTAVTRDNAERAAAELASRHTTDQKPEQRVSASEWLEIERTHRLEDDQHREITDEADFTCTPLQQADRDHAAQADHAVIGPALDPIEPDIRQLADTWPTRADDGGLRVPTADETADAVHRAQLALAEMNRRITLDNAREAEYERSQQLARWHEADRAAESNLGHDLGYDC